MWIGQDVPLQEVGGGVFQFWFFQYVMKIREIEMVVLQIFLIIFL